jgi:uncharacterized protein (TIGR02266 family)
MWGTWADVRRRMEPPGESMSEFANIPPDSRRVPLENRIQLKFDRFSGFVSEYTANLSPSGVFIKTRDPKPPGTVLEFEFRLGDGFELIRGRGEVIWNRRQEEGTARPAGMGVRFLELSPGSRELIYRLVEDHVQAGGTPFDVSEMPEPEALPAVDPFQEMAAGLPPLDDDFDLLPEPSVPEAPSPPPPEPAASRPFLAAEPPELPQPSEPRAVPPGAAWNIPPEPAPPLAFPSAVSLSAAAPFSGGDPAPPERPDLEPIRFETYSPRAVATEPAVPPAAAATPPPSVFDVQGRAAASRKLPSKWFWGALAAIALLLGAGYAERERVLSWVGIADPTAESEMIPPATSPAPPAVAAAAPHPPSATAPAAATPAAGGPGGPPSAPDVAAVPPAPLPEKVEPAPAGPPATVLEKITWEQKPEGTDLILWADGVFRRGGYSQVRVGGEPPREVVRINGAARPFRFLRLAVGTPEVRQIRVGFHQSPAGNEIHVVMDLADAAVKVVGVEEQGRQLRLQLRRP